MSKIKLFALGGLNEEGKNMYVVKVDNDIFVFDAGLKYASDKLLGVDYVIPNFDYIKENIKNIKDNPNEFVKYKRTILNNIKDFLNKPINKDRDLNSKLYYEYFVKQKENFEKIYNEKVKLITLESNERYELLKEKEKELKKVSLINEALIKENELYKNNFQKLVDDFEKTNAQLYQITNSRSYKLALKFNSLFSFLRKIKNKLRRSK